MLPRCRPSLRRAIRIRLSDLSKLEVISLEGLPSPNHPFIEGVQWTLEQVNEQPSYDVTICKECDFHENCPVSNNPEGFCVFGAVRSQPADDPAVY